MSKVSVVITTYNRAQFLPRAIQSVLQAGSDVEVVVVDDCSTDETPDVCSQLERIRYVRLTANKGLAHARIPMPSVPVIRGRNVEERY
jgi:glycosyltransferase involved in cell wall biosynthesis